MDYKYTELDYAKNIYENGFQSGQHQLTELRLVATYMRRILNYNPKILREEMYKWCEQNIKGYNRELYYKKINSAISKACKKDSMLINVENIIFYKQEMNYLNNLFITKNANKKEESEFSYDCKKLLFTFIFLMKSNKFIVESKNNNIKYYGKYFKGGNKKYNQLKKLAKLPEDVKINEDIINTLWSNNLVTPMFNGLIKLNFMDDVYKIQDNIQKKHQNIYNKNKKYFDSNTDAYQKEIEKDIVFHIKDYDSVGWYFDYYNHKNKIVFCKECGRIFKKKSNRQEYCSDKCSKLVDREKAKKRMKTIRKLECSI